jgi:2-oxoglutarate dehydrogenase E2 component (dihydrolipoamide succinyltransferase)
LESISGSGQSGRVTKKDILAYLDGGRVASAAEVSASVAIAPKTESTVVTPALNQPSGDSGFLSNIKPMTVTPNPGDEIIEMDRMRKLIADHMVMSTHVSPHVTSYVEADVTEIVEWRKRVKKDFMAREGENITFTPIFMEAVVKAIKDFPMINVSVSGTNIVKRKDINIGMATALPSGNLIVPVIKQADRLNLTGLAKSVNELANNARNNSLKPEDIQGGTYTITNVGTFGNVMGTPIINQPQVAILALGAIRKVPAVIETPEGDFIGIRHKMFLSHSYDHRVVDGALGGQFVRRVADYLEQFDPKREI